MKNLKLLSLVLVLLFSFDIYAQEGGKGVQKERGANQQLKLQELGLTPEQMTKMVSIKKESRAKSKKLRSELSTLREEFGTELEKDSLNDSKLKSLAEKMGNLHTEMLLEKVESLKEVKKILTKEQMDKLEFMRMMRPQRGNDRGAKKGKMPQNAPDESDED